MQTTGHKKTKAMRGKNWAVEAIADLCMVEIQNFLIVPQVWERNKPQMRPLREPKGEIVGCYAVAQRSLIVSQKTLRTYARKNEIIFREWMEQLEQAKVVSGIDRRTLTAGTDLPGAPVVCTIIDMTCPELATADSKITSTKDADPTNVTPFRRQ
jgi:hypothetical protein